MNVLVTGGAGFIGSHFCQLLLEKGHSVVALDDLSTGSTGNLAEFADNPKFRLVTGDIRDELLVDEVAAQCDAIVHLAARIGLKVIVESPLETIRVNARGSEVVLDVAAARRIPTMIASTSELYGHSTKIPSAEEDSICFGSPTIGRWSYACTKAYDEFYALALCREKGVPVVVTRFFNTVGPRQTGRYGMVVPRFVTQALSGLPLTVYGDGSQTRCFCSVYDVAGALHTILGRIDQLAGEVFNIGNPQEITILELAQRVIEITESSSPITFVPFSDVYPQGFEEIMRRVPDITKARLRLGFDPKNDLDAILNKVVASIRQREVAA